MGKIERKILIIQPHSDDVLFSAASVLLHDDIKVEILTIENDPKRIKEDEKLFEFLGVKMSHLEVDFKDESYYSYYKNNKSLDIKSVIDFLVNEFGLEKLLEIKQKLLEIVRKKKKSGFEILSPIGVSHPFHFFIHYLLAKESDLFYREFPHSYKRRAREQMLMIQEHFILVEEDTNLEIHKMKFKLAKMFYKSQSGLLFYEQGYIKKELPEEFYKLKTYPYENLDSRL